MTDSPEIDYCELCGRVDGECCPGDLDLHDCNYVEGKPTIRMCCYCCEGVTVGWNDYLCEVDHEPLDFLNWFKLTYPERVIVVETELYVQLYAAAATQGLTVEEFMVQTIIQLANQILDKKESK